MRQSISYKRDEFGRIEEQRAAAEAEEDESTSKQADESGSMSVNESAETTTKDA